MALTGMVAPKQRLLLNTVSRELQECRVVYVRKELTGPPKVAVEFTRPAPSFWLRRQRCWLIAIGVTGVQV